jgi:hypothetical protein
MYICMHSCTSYLQSLFADIREKSLIFSCDMKSEWAREEYTVCCTRNEKSGLTWFKTGIWKLRGMREGYEKGSALYAERMKTLCIH